jgi:putative addiction module component (TIGR02574 family)
MSAIAPLASLRYRFTMSVRATVRNGRLIVDEPTELPEGTVLDLVVDDEGDDLEPRDRDRLHEAIARSLKESVEGRTAPAHVILDALRARRSQIASRAQDDRITGRKPGPCQPALAFVMSGPERGTLAHMAIRPELRDELMKLPAEERLKLADELYTRVPPADDASDPDHAWASEIRQRIEHIRSGAVAGIPANEVFANVRDRLAGHRDL